MVSPCVAHNIINILYSYAYTVRLYNCGHHDIPAQSAKVRVSFWLVLLKFGSRYDAGAARVMSTTGKSIFFSLVKFYF